MGSRIEELSSVNKVIYSRILILHWEFRLKVTSDFYFVETNRSKPILRRFKSGLFLKSFFKKMKKLRNHFSPEIIRLDVEKITLETTMVKGNAARKRICQVKA